jgi:hypothetical protein
VDQEVLIMQLMVLLVLLTLAMVGVGVEPITAVMVALVDLV